MLRFARFNATRPRADAAPPWTALVFGGGLACGIVIAAALGILSKHPGPQRPSPIAASQHYRAEVVRVIDGDTFVARLHVRPDLSVTERVRLLRIDAPELHARCSDEFVKAQAAANALRALLDEGGITLMTSGFDRYGRVLASVATRRTPDVSDAMLAHGLARPYDGGHRGSWCGWKWW